MRGSEIRRTISTRAPASPCELKATRAGTEAIDSVMTYVRPLHAPNHRPRHQTNAAPNAIARPYGTDTRPDAPGVTSGII
jgi:hypothetical protein